MRIRALRWLAILVIALRASVPTGLMPDMAALRDGRFTVVLCTPEGPQAIHADGDPVTDDSPGGANGVGDACPWAMAGTQAWLIAAPPADSTRPAPRRASMSAHAAVDFRPSPRGPPVGTRAPPFAII